jgi:hypothetical protein
LNYVWEKCNEPRVRAVPIELAFLVKCVELLAPSGRLLTLLPSSAITGVGTQWLRQFMLYSGSINRVHEIPPNSFTGVEGRIYLLVFDKHRRRRQIIFCNSDLARPVKIRLQVSELANNLRFDYSFYRAMASQELARVSAQHQKNSDWVHLAELAHIRRGSVEAPFKWRVLHTTDRKGPFWVNSSRSPCVDGSRVTADPGDVLIARVGRGCSNSAGLYCSRRRVTVSDCVLVLHPKGIWTGLEILFAIRVLLKRPGISALLERGTGASYITIEAISSLDVPSTLHLQFSQQFESYRRAVRRRRAEVMQDIESSVAKAIGILKG